MIRDGPVTRAHAMMTPATANVSILRDVSVDDLNLPRGHEREFVHDLDHEYRLRGSESRTLSLVGSFRVVTSRDLRDHDGRVLDARRSSQCLPIIEVA